MIQTSYPAYSKACEYEGMSRLSGYAPVYVNGEIAAVSVTLYPGGRRML
ncbi:hypothetical protein [Domibacillus sp. PGB-M46]|nr:hypothetical protein [Domibacillus sp. PGB-M46]